MRTHEDTSRPQQGRTALGPVAGLTLALLLATALATMPASSSTLSSPASASDRASRMARLISHDVLAGAGYDLVALAALAGPESPAWSINTPSAPVRPITGQAIVAPIKADLAAGLMNLPPPALA